MGRGLSAGDEYEFHGLPMQGTSWSVEDLDGLEAFIKRYLMPQNNLGLPRVRRQSDPYYTYKRKDNKKVPTTKELQERLARLELQMASAREDLAKLSRFPEDTFTEGTVLRFDKQFNPNGRTYSYVAIKCSPRNASNMLISDRVWFTSGPRKPGPFTWEELCDFWSSGVDAVWQMTYPADRGEPLPPLIDLSATRDDF